MTIIVTGAAGFIGSNIVKALNQRGITDIVAVDNLTRGEKFKNLAECEIAHYLDKHEFIRQVRGHLLPYENIEAVFHQGACSDTMNHDGLYMMDNNYQYTLDLLDWCQDERIPFLYASSAAVYGKGEIFREERELEKPLNLYFFDHPNLSGIYNLGTGRSQQFNELAAATVNACRAAEGKPELSLKELIEEELIRYIPFPDALKGKYQSFTQADITKLREAGYKEGFLDVKAGVGRYVKWMLENLA